MPESASELDQWSDPLWRLSNLYWIVDKSGQRRLFQPNEAQVNYLRGATSADIILKARQLGMTTLMCLISLDEALFLKDHNAAIIAHTLNDANVIFETKVKFPYDNLPEMLRQRRPATNDRAGLLKFNHGSSIRVATSARSGTLQRLHVSEFGKICCAVPEESAGDCHGLIPGGREKPRHD